MTAPSDRSASRSTKGARGVRARLDRLREELAAINPGDPIVGLKPVDDARVRGTAEIRTDTGRTKKVSFIIAADAAHRLGIAPGSAWTHTTTDGIIDAVARDEAMRAALAAVSRSATSTRRLIDKLCQKGHDRALATAAAARIAEMGMIDDAAAAEAAARTIARRTPSGRAMIESRLRASGFDGTIARAAAAGAASERDPKADALALAQKKARVLGRGLDPLARRRRVEAALARRGFDPELCRWAARKALGPDSGQDPES